MEEGTLYNALQHVRREGGCEEVWEDMVPQHHPAHRAPPGTSQHHPTPPGLLMVWASQTSSHPPSRRTCCRALYSSLTSFHHSPELYSLYSIIQRCILYSYTAYTLYSTIQSPSVTFTHPGQGKTETFSRPRRARKVLEHRVSGCRSRLSVTSVEHWRLSYPAPPPQDNLQTAARGDGLTPG